MSEEEGKLRSTGDPLLDAAVEKARGRKPFEEVDLESFYRLFQFTSKRELEKYARRLVVHDGDLVLFILACMTNEGPFRHMKAHREYVPQHLIPTEKDHETIGQNLVVGKMPPDVAKVFGKFDQIFKDRRLLNGHMFICPHSGQWHFFYFDQRDTSKRQPHWEHGAHIHFVNWLWPGLTAQGVWEKFAHDKPKFKGALHLRYMDLRDGYEPRRVGGLTKKKPQK